MGRCEKKGRRTVNGYWKEEEAGKGRRGGIEVAKIVALSIWNKTITNSNNNNSNIIACETINSSWSSRDNF